VLCLISGGGSALLAMPAEGITLEEKQSINKALLRSGAAIDEMNCVRKHLSAIKGGRNAEFLLALAVALDGHPGIAAIAADTDGIDGSEDNAGALLGPDSIARAAAVQISAKERLAANDGYGFFAAVGDLVATGPTRTNVNDFRAILIRTSG